MMDTPTPVSRRHGSVGTSMSLFQAQEWLSAVFPNAHSLCVANLVEGRDQIIVGTLDGTLCVLDPGKDPEHRDELANLTELHLGRPILQLLADTFLPLTFDEPILAVLLPNSLLYFRLFKNGESFVCEQIFEHRISGPPAFNMCHGHFGHSSIPQLCVQSLQSNLHLFEAENRVLHRSLPDILHPGPLGYSLVSESLLLASSGSLISLRYTSLTAIGTKKLNIDWSLFLGDTAIQMTILNGSVNELSSDPVQSSLLVLCKRTLYCITHWGNPRFSIHFQSVALCMTILNCEHNAHIPLCIGTNTRTVLFYSDTRLIWSAQLPFIPQQVSTCTFNESLRSLLTLLSIDGNLIIGYLGTEPSLFRMPVTESRFINFEAKRKELRELEELIWRNKPAEVGLTDMEVNVQMNDHSIAFNAVEGVTSAQVSVSFTSSSGSPSTVLFQSELHCAEGSQFVIPPGAVLDHFTLSIFCHQEPVFDSRCQLLVYSNVLRFLEFSIPLSLICHITTAQRQATFKLSLDSDKSSLDIATLFPEFINNKDKTSLGLLPFFGEQNTIVSLFVSAKTNRYRIQSDSTDFLYVVFSSLVERIHRLQPDVRLRCPVPLHMFLVEFLKYIEAENEYSRMEQETCRESIQMRHAETLALNKLKAYDTEKTQSKVQGNALLNYTYGELTKVLDKMGQLQQKLSRVGRRPLRSLLNLINALLQLNDLNLPFDGRIQDGTDQKLGERISQILTPPEETRATELSAEEVGRLLTKFCEHGIETLGEIVEEEDEKVEKKELEEAIERAEEQLGLIDLQSGSLPARQFSEGIR